MFLAMWDELGKSGFRHRERYGSTFRALYEAEYSAPDPVSRQHLAFVRKWLLVPASVWPIDFCGFGKHLVWEIKNGRSLSRRVELILRMVRRFPSKAAQAIIFEHENESSSGDYGRFFKSSAKFESLQHAKEIDPLFLEDLQALHDEFNIDKKQYRDADGIIRRSLVLERNRRPDDFYITSLDEEEQEFQLAFTAFCFEHNLWGIIGNKPLLLKVSVNPTPYSVLLEIPCYLLPDFRRDFNYTAIARLLESLGAEGLGDKRARNDRERLDLALRVWQAALQAEANGLKGEDRICFITKEGGMSPNDDARKIRKLLSVARDHLGLPPRVGL